MRVTVVATGIGAERKPDISLVSNRTSKLGADAGEFKLQANSSEKVGAMATDGNKALAAEEKVEAGTDLEYLDIPAFLRKQAD